MGCTIRYGPPSHRSLFGYNNQNILSEVEEDRQTLFRIVTRGPKSYANCTCHNSDEVEQLTSEESSPKMPPSAVADSSPQTAQAAANNLHKTHSSPQTAQAAAKNLHKAIKVGGIHFKIAEVNTLAHKAAATLDGKPKSSSTKVHRVIIDDLKYAR